MMLYEHNSGIFKVKIMEFCENFEDFKSILLRGPGSSYNSIEAVREQTGGGAAKLYVDHRPAGRQHYLIQATDSRIRPLYCKCELIASSGCTNYEYIKFQ